MSAGFKHLDGLVADFRQSLFLFLIRDGVMFPGSSLDHHWMQRLWKKRRAYNEFIRQFWSYSHTRLPFSVDFNSMSNSECNFVYGRVVYHNGRDIIEAINGYEHVLLMTTDMENK